ncbi:hypothetical protein EMIT051CA3_20123 [Pseudomonas chlororaphis]
MEPARCAGAVGAAPGPDRQRPARRHAALLHRGLAPGLSPSAVHALAGAALQQQPQRRAGERDFRSGALHQFHCRLAGCRAGAGRPADRRPDRRGARAAGQMRGQRAVRNRGVLGQQNPVIAQSPVGASLLAMSAKRSIPNPRVLIDRAGDLQGERYALYREQARSYNGLLFCESRFWPMRCLTARHGPLL